MHLGYLAYTHYMVEIRFYGLESHTFNVKEITFYVSLPQENRGVFSQGFSL